MVVVGLLVCDRPIESLIEKHGDYGIDSFYLVHMFTELLAGASERTKIPIDIKAFHVMQGEYPHEALDGLLITGSKFDAYSDQAWIAKLREYVRATTIRTVGICFGHQIIAQALDVTKNPKGWEAGNSIIQLNEEGKTIFGKEQLRINEMHQDIVSLDPSGIKILGGNSVCSNQIMISNRFCSFQGHPEFSNAFVADLALLRKGLKIFSNEFYDNVIKNLSNDIDSKLIADFILQFFAGNIKVI